MNLSFNVICQYTYPIDEDHLPLQFRSMPKPVVVLRLSRAGLVSQRTYPTGKICLLLQPRGCGSFEPTM